MRAQDVELKVSDEAVDYLANAGLTHSKGAPAAESHPAAVGGRALERLLAGEIEPGQRVLVDLRDGRLNVETMPEAEPVGEASETGAGP